MLRCGDTDGEIIKLKLRNVEVCPLMKLGWNE